ncbi:MAG: hypothetical protein AAF560_10080 [Acidobacteriota bacterium]
MQYDFVIYDQADRPVAVLEAKAQQGTTAQWASAFRRNLLAHQAHPETEYFGIITPAAFYLWRGQNDPRDVPPDFELDLSDYTRSLPKEALRGNAFEFVVSSLLTDLESTPSDRWPSLSNSGFLDALKTGRLSYEAAA